MKSIASLLLIGLALSFSSAQSGSSKSSAPDFSGTWKVDFSLSTARINFLDSLTFVISQKLPELRVKRMVTDKKQKERTDELIYHTDGRDGKISLLLSDDKWKSKTTLVGNTLVAKYTVMKWWGKGIEDFTTHRYYVDYKETWALSEDGNTLTITTEATARGNVPEFKVYLDPQNLSPVAKPYRKVFHRIPSDSATH